MQSVDARRQSSGDEERQTATPQLTEHCDAEAGTMPGLIERYNGQHVVSLTANIHGMTLGEALPELNQALAKRGRAAERRQRSNSVARFRRCKQTISGLRIGLLLAVLVIFLLLAANFQSMRLALRSF